MRKLVLIDGHALAYRAFFALPVQAFSTKSGEPTNATYGFIRTVMDIILSNDPPEYLAVSFDVGKTFRDEIFPDYKGTREKMPDELRPQIDRIREVVAAFNIPILELPGYEADDVLGTVAQQAKDIKVPVHIVTGDRDLLQLVDENTLVELPPGRYQKQPSIYDEAAVFEKLGVRPDQVVDYKAMVGDASDNIPGVRGVGQKTAEKLLAQYQTLDGIYDHIEELKGAVKTKLENGKENAYLSYKLAMIITDAPITLDIDACVTKEYEVGGVSELFRELEFRTLTNRIAETLDELPKIGTQPPTEVVIVRNKKQLAELEKILSNSEEISFDVETTGLDERTAQLVGICLAVESPTAYYIPLGHLRGDVQNDAGQLNLFSGEAILAEGQLPLDVVLDSLRPFLTDLTIPKIARNAKYDYAVLEKDGVRVEPLSFDTMIGEWLTDPARQMPTS